MEAYYIITRRRAKRRVREFVASPASDDVNSLEVYSIEHAILMLVCSPEFISTALSKQYLSRQFVDKRSSSGYGSPARIGGIYVSR